MWDVTVSDSLAPSYLENCAQTTCYAATLAETNKISKYAALGDDYIFSPIAFETLAGPGPKTRHTLDEICKRLLLATGSHMTGLYFRQHLSLAIQRGNVAAVLGTMRDDGGPVRPPIGPEGLFY